MVYFVMLKIGKLRVQILPPPKIFFDSNQKNFIASVRAVAVGEDEETRRERERS